MEFSELSLWVARLAVLFLMYLLIFVLILALRADARAAVETPYIAPRPHSNIPISPPKPMSVQTNSSYSLLVTKGTIPVAGREYSLYGPVEIGRGANCQISIPKNFVSTHHARIYNHQGRWELEDLGSTNGTFLNGQLIENSTPLNHGDRILVGDTEMVIQ